MRRLTRLTNAFSRKWENLRFAVALFVFSYNFRRIASFDPLYARDGRWRCFNNLDLG
jgi:hypothetical protein